MIEIKESTVYCSGHLYPVNSDDKLKVNVVRDGRIVETFHTRSAADEFATLLDN